MSNKSNQAKGFIKALPKNIFSGLVVSLIALPLGLGLAMASEAPPIAGVIAAIVGGVLVSILGGSNVTISGPGNGLVGVLLIAIATLGLNSAYAAIICSGLLLIVLGFLRLGKLANYFPSSAIQGMLAAIGLIILGKQFHIMLANKITRANSVDYLLEIPNTIKQVFLYTDSSLTYAAIAGVLSLAIMIFYPKIRNKYLQLIPAPMWIVLLSIGFSYYVELVLKTPNPIHPQYMISGIPSINEIVTQLPTPNFSNVFSWSFFSSVLALTLIASIESLLSIKAVDKLDPEKRRSNVNKDIKALGLATIVSGFLGGLNVVTVIARSSVNVNNGGTNRSANFFHALFLLLFIMLFSTQLTRIPLPALMAILVFTGYKLASPKKVISVFNIGKEQLIIFFTTLIVTLKIGLITGILAGVLVTLIIHFVISKNVGLFLKNILKPNVLMFKEEGGVGNYFVSVKHYCTFLNYTKLKQKLDEIPENKEVIVDFSLCEFVDHTVMENLHSYQELFQKKGGHFDVTGLDMHNADSAHPFALRRVLPVAKIFASNLTRRQNTLKALATDYKLVFNTKKVKNTSFLNDYNYFKTKKINFIYNQLSDNANELNVFDIEFSEGEFIAKEVVRSTMLQFNLEEQIPKFSIDKEGFLEKMQSFTVVHDIALKNHPDFSKRFLLTGVDEIEIKAFFNDDTVHFFESNPYYHVESKGNSVLIYQKERLASIKELKAMLNFGKQLKKQFSIVTKCTTF